MTIFSDSNILKNANPLPDLVCLMSGFLLHVRGNYQLKEQPPSIDSLDLICRFIKNKILKFVYLKSYRLQSDSFKLSILSVPILV